ncbi:hypothetical protein M0Q97_09650 [Candidatus Dojkabacteria bacterium]|jgi:hypothetical protein|nr:hypothetical protein [Candidatus Dojkabacteria bacterium]
MPRPKRKKLTIDEESVNKLLQEIYDESHNIKAKITRLFTKWETKVKESGEVAAIGDQIVKLIAAEAKNQDQKIMLLRYLKDVVFDIKNNTGNTSENNNNNEEKNDLTTKRRNQLLDFVQEEIERKNNDK